MLGKIFESKGSGSFIVMSRVEGKERFLIKFIKTGYTSMAYRGNIKKGEVKDLLIPSVYGRGYLGGKKYSTSNYKGGHDEAYSAWKRMLQRCYCESYRCFSAYSGRGVTVAKEWLNYQNFAEWYYSRELRGEGYELDKDLKDPEGTLYSKDTCLLIPPKLNKMLSKSNTSKTSTGLKGVCRSGETSYRVKVGEQYIGCYPTKEEAFNVYKMHKKENLISLGERLYSQGVIDLEILTACRNWEVPNGFLEIK